MHSGPKFEIASRYAKLMNIVWVTMMYGAGLPILFPIACLSFLVTYFMEMYLLFYIYQKPPRYDSRLHIDQLRTLE